MVFFFFWIKVVSFSMKYWCEDTIYSGVKKDHSQFRRTIWHLLNLTLGTNCLIWLITGFPIAIFNDHCFQDLIDMQRLYLLYNLSVTPSVEADFKDSKWVKLILVVPKKDFIKQDNFMDSNKVLWYLLIWEFSTGFYYIPWF